MRRNHMRPYVALQVRRTMWPYRPAAAAQVKGPYATICDLTGRSVWQRGRDRLRPYVSPFGIRWVFTGTPV